MTEPEAVETVEPDGSRKGLDWQYYCGFGLVILGVLAVAVAVRKCNCDDKESVGGDDAPLVGASVDPDSLVVAEVPEHSLKFLGVNGAGDLGESFSGVTVPVLGDDRVGDLVEPFAGDTEAGPLKVVDDAHLLAPADH